MRERCSVGLVLAGSIAIGVLCCASPAAAASIAVAQPSACGDGDELVRGVERGVGSPLSDASPLHFDVSIARDGANVVARLVIEADGATPRLRRLEAPDCDTLAETVAVAVALALGEEEDAARERSTPRAALEAGAPADAATGPAARPVDVTPAAPDRDSSPAARSERSRATLEPALSLWLLGDVGSLPVPSIGAALAFDLRWAWLDIVALGSVLFDRDIDLGSASAPGAGATLGLFSGALLACTHTQNVASRLDARACIGAELGYLDGVGTGISDPEPGGSVWVAPRIDGSGFLAVAGTPLRLGVWLTAAAPANRDELVIEGVGRAHRPPAIVGRGAIGAELRFR